MQQGQEVTADGVVIGFHFNAFAIVRKMVPVEQHGAVACHQFVGNVACAGVIVVVLLRCDAAQHRYAGAHHVHWVRGRWQLFQSDFDRLRQAALREAAIARWPEARALLEEFAGRYPTVELELLFPLMEDVTELLKSGRAQLGISYQKAHPERELVSRSLGSVAMPLVVSPDHPLAHKTPLHESDLQGARQLMHT